MLATLIFWIMFLVRAKILGTKIFCFIFLTGESSLSKDKSTGPWKQAQAAATASASAGKQQPILSTKIHLRLRVGYLNEV